MNHIYAGTSKGLYNLHQNIRELDGSAVRALAISEGLWAVVNENEIWYKPVNRPWSTKTQSEESLHCMLPTDSGIYTGGSNARLFMLKENKLHEIEGFRNVNGKEQWFNPAASAPNIRSMTTDGKNIYVNVHVGGILRSDDGISWTPTIDVDSDVHQVYWDPETRQLLAATARGLAISSDMGNRWGFNTDGLHSSYCRAVTCFENYIFVTASTGPYTEQGAIYCKRKNSKEPFWKCHQGLPEWFSGNIDTHCLISKNKEIVLGSPDGHVFISRDPGSGWENIAQDLGKVYCLVIGE